MDLREFVRINKNKTQLDEGIKFFKDSKRLQKVADKIGHEAFKKGGKEGYKEVEEIVEKVKEIGKKFSEIENKFSNAEDKEEKERVKKDYEELKEEYKELVKLINQNTFAVLIKNGFKISMIAVTLGLSVSGMAVLDQAFFENPYITVEQKNAFIQRIQQVATKVASIAGVYGILDIIQEKIYAADLLKGTKKALKSLEKKRNNYSKSEEE